MPLIEDLINSGYLKTPNIIKAFRIVKRQDFLISGNSREAEINAPIAIGYDQTISQPLTVAFMLELLVVRYGDKVLDVGSGSGWTTALLAQLVGSQGKVYALEIIPELKKFGEKNVNRYNFINRGIVHFFCADGREGLPEFSPFDRILVSAAAETTPPALQKQLAVGGRMVIPIGQEYHSQEIVVFDKQVSGRIKESSFPGFIFVPLT